VLCHDFGASRASMLHLGLLLQNEGFPVLLFDFRGHGESSRARSTLGLHEKRDVLAAVDQLRRLGPETDRVGLYGIGMGAHAAVLAARERPRLRVLVLDGLYPDVSFRLVRRVYAGWDVGIRRLGFLPESVFELISGTSAVAERAEVVLGQLVGRDVLLLASETDPALHAAIRHMYDSIPPQPDVDGNLLVLPATQSDGLYGDDLALHHDRVVSFFRERLRRS
jgi:pimeloyl-ACP methyl ester carboxylesterase